MPASPDRERLGLQPSLQKLPSLLAPLPLPGLSGWQRRTAASSINANAGGGSLSPHPHTLSLGCLQQFSIK